MSTKIGQYKVNPLNAELNPICHLLAFLRAHHILHVSRLRVNLTSRIDLFYQCRINFYQTHTCSSLLLAFAMPRATSVTVRVIAQKITDIAHFKPQ